MLKQSLDAVKRLKNARHIEELAEITSETANKCHRFKKPPSNRYDGNFKYHRYHHKSKGCCPYAFYTNEPEGVDEGLDDEERYFSGQNWESKNFRAMMKLQMNGIKNCFATAPEWWQSFYKKFYFEWFEESNEKKAKIYHEYKFGQEITDRSMYYLKDSHPVVNPTPPRIVDKFEKYEIPLDGEYITYIYSASLEISVGYGMIWTVPDVSRPTFRVHDEICLSMLNDTLASTVTPTINNGSTNAGYLDYKNPLCNATDHTGRESFAFVYTKMPTANAGVQNFITDGRVINYRGFVPSYDKLILESHAIFAGGMPRLKPFFGWYQREIAKAKKRFARLEQVMKLPQHSRDIDWFRCHAYPLVVALEWETNLIELLERAKWKYFVQTEPPNGIMPGDRQYFPLNDFTQFSALRPMIGWSDDDPRKQIAKEEDLLGRIIQENLPLKE